MNKRFQIVFVASACALILASIAVVSPKAVHAAIATLIRDQDNAAKHPFTLTCAASTTTNENVCQIPASPPAEYVIQNVAITQSSAGANSLSVFGRATTGGVTNLFLLASIPGFNLAGENLNQLALAVTAYADPGTAVTVVYESSNPINPPFYGFPVYITGYYVTLP